MAVPPPPRSSSDAHWLGALPAPGPRVGAVRTSSAFVTMRDGVRLAVDVHRTGTQPAPAIVHQTRYLRALSPRGLLGRVLPIGGLFDVHRRLRARFLRAGYAWLDVDVRGTGASDGVWVTPWHADQRRDGYELVDWIVRQPWSNGRVGSLGISYDGTCADMLLVDHHPAVRAIAPLFSLYDAFADVGFPGGIHLAWFTQAWSDYNAALDRNAFHAASTWPLWILARAAAAAPAPGPRGWLARRVGRVPEVRFRRTAAGALRRLVAGVADVQARGDGVKDPAALAARADNLDVAVMGRRVEHRDDAGLDPRWPDLTIDSFSPHRFAAEQRASGAAIYSYSGWRDGGYAHGAIKRFLSAPTEGSRLTIGPWTHAGLSRVHAFARSVPATFDHAGELHAFFDEHLRDAPATGDGRPIHYYTTGADRWNAATVWPPPGFAPRTLFLSPGALQPGLGGRATSIATPIDPPPGNGERSRWRTLLGPAAGDYADFDAQAPGRLAFDSPPLAANLELTGHPVARLWLSWDGGDDGHVFAVLLDVAPNGRSWVLTDGQLRARHRAQTDHPPATSPAPSRSFERGQASAIRPGEAVELVFDLLPLSHELRTGHRLRLCLTGSDRDHFAPHPPGATELRVHVGPERPSCLEIPVAMTPVWRTV